MSLTAIKKKISIRCCKCISRYTIFSTQMFFTSFLTHSPSDRDKRCKILTLQKVLEICPCVFKYSYFSLVFFSSWKWEWENMLVVCNRNYIHLNKIPFQFSALQAEEQNISSISLFSICLLHFAEEKKILQEFTNAL